MRISRLLVSTLMAVLAGLSITIPAQLARADFDHTRYLSPDEVRPGMKGVGRTVMSGTKIERFQFEVIGVMRNAYYARQDVILVRCSGLNLEHSGIIAGMSGSPCYVVGDDGKERMIGAVAYGWTFNKDPICGVQPITQMLPIAQFRAPRAADTPARPTTQPMTAGMSGKGVSVGEILARAAVEPARPGSRFSIFNDDIVKFRAASTQSKLPDGLQPLMMPVMVSGLSSEGMKRVGPQLERFGMVPVASGAPSAAAAAEFGDTRIEPGSAFVVPMLTGDLMMEGLGTCTEVDGDRVFAFGHAMFGQGSVELPFSTGLVHTVIPSVTRSTKIGAAIKPVGTLWGDESSGIYGLMGKTPATIPMEVVVRDVRGEQTYHYQVVQDENLTPMLVGMAMMESVMSHSEPPREHTIRYAIETEFAGLGTFRTSNLTSQSSIGDAYMETMFPVAGMTSAPFGKAKVARVRVELTVEKGARVGEMDEVTLARTLYKPGEKVAVHIRWQHPHSQPQYTEADYDLTLPKDLPDGEYDLTATSASGALLALRSEKPHLFRADSLPELLASMNRIGSFPDNRVYLRLGLPTGGLAVKNMELPELPSYRQQILLAGKRTDVQKYKEAQVVQYETDFAVSGSRALRITVSRRADQ
jgi:hypothetical protein